MPDYTTPEQFTKAYEAYADAIFRHCFFRVRNREIALDLMQETFLKTWQHIQRASAEIANIRPFLYTVANNLVIDRSRKKREASLESLLEQGFNPGVPAEAEKRDSIAEQEVFKLLDGINPKYREAVLLRYVDEFSPKEIAEILGISENNASVRIHYGLKAVRRKYPPQEISPAENISSPEISP